MDQIKAQLAVALRFGFWIGSALILISSLVAWYMSTSTLAQETESESSRLEGVIRKISTVRGAMSELPNEKSHEVMNEMIKKRQDEVLQSWQTLFDRQEPYLTWPKDELGDDFVALFEGKIPIEQYIDFPNTKELTPYYLNRYRDHITKEPAKLAKIAGAIWTASDDNKSSGLSTLGGGNSDEIEETPVVAWSTASQKSLENELFRWHGDTPTTLECYYSQESQWILKQLMMIIKEVNGDATQPYQAKIREIEEIHIGPSVNFSVGEFTGIQGSGSMTSLGDSGSTSQLGGGRGGGGGLSGMSSGGGIGGASAGPTTDPAERRYVDTNLKHIAASALRTALKSNKPSDASLAVAKRVPIMMGLKMDQRTVHELLAACGSADLMVEVTHVRILEKSGKSSASRSGGGAGGLGALGGGGSSRTSSSSGSSDADEFPFDVNVKLYGMIYIYNTPDPNKLPVEQITKETVDEALGETPVTETPETETPAAVDESLPQDNEVLQPPVDGAEPPTDATAVPTDGVQPPADPVPVEP
jgi:hypothetical protein